MDLLDLRTFGTLPLKALEEVGLNGQVLSEIGIVVGLFTLVLTGVLLFFGFPTDDEPESPKAAGVDAPKPVVEKKAPVVAAPPPPKPVVVEKKPPKPVVEKPPAPVVEDVEPTVVVPPPDPKPQPKEEVKPALVVVPPPPEVVEEPPPPERPAPTPPVEEPKPAQETATKEEPQQEAEEEPPKEEEPKEEEVAAAEPSYTTTPPPVVEEEEPPASSEEKPPEEEETEKKGWLAAAGAAVMAAVATSEGAAAQEEATEAETPAPTEEPPAPPSEPVPPSEPAPPKTVAFEEPPAAEKEPETRAKMVTQQSWLPGVRSFVEEDEDDDDEPAEEAKKADLAPLEEEEEDKDTAARTPPPREEPSEAPKEERDLVTSSGGSIGQRDTMEDAYDVFAATSKYAAAAVLDGSHGRRAAETALKVLKEWFAGSQKRSTDEATLKDALARAEQVCLSTAAKNGKWVDATTAVVACADETIIRVAWVGDASATLVGADDWTMLTSPHVAGNPDEANRVKTLGGKVGRSQSEAKAGKAQKLLGKVAGKATVFKTLKTNPKRCYPGGTVFTRALGGLPLKYSKPKLVTADPEVAQVSRSDTDLCLVLASDGLYEKLDVDHVVDELRRAARDKDKQANVAERLCAEAQDQATSDNICAVVLWFN